MNPSRVVIILGPYRSGTSLTARIVAELGTNFGPADALIPANDLNPTGYQERDDINAANEAFIRSAGGTLEKPGRPETLVADGALDMLRNLNLEWMRSHAVVGIKDPRLCATLLAWFRAGLLRAETCRLVHIRRDLDAITASAVRHHTVAGYCDNDPARVRAMISVYNDYAKWHVQQKLCPTLSIDYANLLVRPKQTTTEIASFLGVTSRSKIGRAAELIGKKKARRRLAWKNQLLRLRIWLGGLKQRLYSLIEH